MHTDARALRDVIHLPIGRARPASSSSAAALRSSPACSRLSAPRLHVATHARRAHLRIFARSQKQFPNWKKRRLYDVMSICQCLRVVERSCKSQFVWRGIRRVQSAVYEFLLRDMAIRPILDGHTELDPDEPAVPVTGLAFLCQQFVLLLRQRALDDEAPAISLEEATQQLCKRVKTNDDKTVLRRLYDVINVLESIDLLERSPSVKRGVQWKGPSLTDVNLPPGCPRVEPTRFKDLLRKQPMRKRAAAELLAVQSKRPRINKEGGSRRSAHAARGAVFARLEDPTRRSLHRAIEEVESHLSWQPPKAYALVWHIYAAMGRHAHPLKLSDGCESLLSLPATLAGLSRTSVTRLKEWGARLRHALKRPKPPAGADVDAIDTQAVLALLKDLSAVLRADRSARSSLGGGLGANASDESSTGGAAAFVGHGQGGACCATPRPAVPSPPPPPSLSLSPSLSPGLSSSRTSPPLSAPCLSSSSFAAPLPLLYLPLISRSPPAHPPLTPRSSPPPPSPSLAHAGGGGDQPRCRHHQRRPRRRRRSPRRVRPFQLRGGGGRVGSRVCGAPSPTPSEQRKRDHRAAAAARARAEASEGGAGGGGLPSGKGAGGPAAAHGKGAEGKRAAGRHGALPPPPPHGFAPPNAMAAPPPSQPHASPNGALAGPTLPLPRHHPTPRRAHGRAVCRSARWRHAPSSSCGRPAARHAAGRPARQHPLSSRRGLPRPGRAHPDGAGRRRLPGRLRAARHAPPPPVPHPGVPPGVIGGPHGYQLAPYPTPMTATGHPPPAAIYGHPGAPYHMAYAPPQAMSSMSAIHQKQQAAMAAQQRAVAAQQQAAQQHMQAQQQVQQQQALQKAQQAALSSQQQQKPMAGVQWGGQPAMQPAAAVAAAGAAGQPQPMWPARPAGGFPVDAGGIPRSTWLTRGQPRECSPRRRARPAPALPRGGAPPMAAHGGAMGTAAQPAAAPKDGHESARHASEVLAKARADAAGREAEALVNQARSAEGPRRMMERELEKKWPVQPPQQQRPPPPQRPLPPSTAAPSAPRAAPPNATAGPTTPAAAPAASTAASTAAAGTASTAASPASAASSTANDPTGQQAMRAHAANFAMQAAAAKAAAARQAQSSQQQQAHDQTRKAAATAGGQGAPSSSQPSKVKMTELLQVITDFLAGTNQHAKAAQVAETSAQYRSGTVSYQQAMLVLSEAVGREQLVQEVTRLSRKAVGPSAPR